MRARTMPADDATLVTADAALRDLADVAAVRTPNGKTWSLDAVEQMFQRFGVGITRASHGAAGHAGRP